MIILIKKDTPPEQIEEVIVRLKKHQIQPLPIYNGRQTVIVATGATENITIQTVLSWDEVETATITSAPYKLAARANNPEGTIITVNNVKIGGKHLAIMAGPCSVESREQLDEAAKKVKAAGANILRGGAFKPRTGPYAFQGLGEEGLILLKKIGEKYNMPVITEVLDPRDVELVEEYADIFQIGARNMQNFRLLEAVGKSQTPVMLKRGASATIEELLLAAEYILSNGNMNVILCERGIRTFEKETRNTLCLATVPVVQKLSHLPIIIDPSHGTGNPDYIPAMTYAAIAAGANGVMIEVHPNPPESLSDADQALTPAEFAHIMQTAAPIISAVNKQIN
ncbi:3-deoxy-7-phosphoheptulonate synthase [Candidatus Peregrinibacteria bacterium CG11_big_fil_rev_8_21_14_0_20_41_10]|nr:MAG: 3-deoxy-7-phosphoheptulonate synthase [Candidatus Peregrinibacteria bacterium CG11_big_fil_rev_8_21_14_0_20_41_10]PIZ73343.1 MAG: 3-deoxy-7-phosphoheptulonate synthase [Candidatus Peregrinibacteria bacterium CG_4_10_14_0_2_um_filter_41_8]